MAGSDALPEALQDALAAEHAALYVVGVLGGRTSQSAAPVLFTRLTSAYDRHRDQRDRLVAELERLGVDPVGAEAAYVLPGGLGSAAGVETALGDLETRLCAAYAALVSASISTVRRWAGETLTACALAALDAGEDAEPLPGLPHLD
ncbi:ferritin-like domain-containing protein [Nocardioides acrostichi]|uniref:Ferritin-like domain-containing protein n=1 Tax=Nocardioides acrostichi TaxID=2784339 RepID=A0A930Y4S2_9ACTN|nr:ferritin-like domain-containing protein [Nocardioides acrostichi]MBF4160505.1 ferritin-like domain-containing protein [Nocardioides acrostichi]